MVLTLTVQGPTYSEQIRANIIAAEARLGITNVKKRLTKSFQQKLGCDWLMFWHQQITAKLSAKSFQLKAI